MQNVTTLEAILLVERALSAGYVVRVGICEARPMQTDIGIRYGLIQGSYAKLHKLADSVAEWFVDQIGPAEAWRAAAELVTV